jgi:hypothetical protein
MYCTVDILYRHTILSKIKFFEEYIYTSGVWPRVRARALRAPVFLGSLPRQTGRCAPPLPAHRSFAVSYLTPKNILNLSNLGLSRQGPFPFHRNQRL